MHQSLFQLLVVCAVALFAAVAICGFQRLGTGSPAVARATPQEVGNLQPADMLAIRGGGDTGSFCLRIFNAVTCGVGGDLNTCVDGTGGGLTCPATGNVTENVTIYTIRAPDEKDTPNDKVPKAKQVLCSQSQAYTAGTLQSGSSFTGGVSCDSLGFYAGSACVRHFWLPGDWDCLPCTLGGPKTPLPKKGTFDCIDP